MAASTPIKNTVSTEEEWIAATKEKKKHCTLTKLFSAIKHSNLQGNMLSGTTALDHSLFF